MSDRVEWIGVDWGTSNVRAWGISDTGEIAFAVEADKGMGRLTPKDYPDTLTELLGGQALGTEPLDVVICGMAGAKQGWCEAPYMETPANLTGLGQNAVIPPMPKSNLRPRILAGVCQMQSGVENVMRGEETQLLGLLALEPGFSGTVCMPGTHSKWVRIKDGCITSFSTAMTGELFELLRTHSVLRHSMPDEPIGQSTEASIDIEAGMSEGMETGINDPDKVTTNLFRTRAAALLADKSPHWCVGYLSGLLIGGEVGGHRDWIGDAPVPIIGSSRLCRLYTTALKKIGAKAQTIDATSATLAGLTAARGQITK